MIFSDIKKGEVIQSLITSLTFIPKTDFYVQNVLFIIEPKLLIKNSACQEFIDLLKYCHSCD